MLVTHRQCMTLVAAGNTNPVTLISYSFVCLGCDYNNKSFTETVSTRAGCQFLTGRLHILGVTDNYFRSK